MQSALLRRRAMAELGRKLTPVRFCRDLLKSFSLQVFSGSQPGGSSPESEAWCAVTPDPVETQRRLQETRNERALNVFRGVLFLVLLVGHAFVEDSRSAVMLLLALANLGTFLGWLYFRRDRPYWAGRKYLIAELDLVVVTLVMLKVETFIPPVVRPPIFLCSYLLLLILNGLRYSPRLIVLLGAEQLLVYLTKIVPDALEVLPAAVSGIVILGSGTLLMASLVQSLLALLRESVLRRLASERKNLFVADVSHELRTPLTSILGYVDLLRDGLEGQLSPRQVQTLDVIARHGQALLGTINDLLDFSKMEAGKLELHRVPLPLTECLEYALALVEPQLRGVETVVDVPPEPVLVEADFLRMGQVFVNLLGNAARFTREGQVGIRLERVGSCAEVSVWDTGVGLPEGDLERLFSEYQQGDRKPGGTGLGLAIARRIVRAHGGELTASRRPQGAEFRVRLPLA